MQKTSGIASATLNLKLYIRYHSVYCAKPTQLCVVRFVCNIHTMHHMYSCCQTHKQLLSPLFERIHCLTGLCLQADCLNTLNTCSTSPLHQHLKNVSSALCRLQGLRLCLTFNRTIGCSLSGVSAQYGQVACSKKCTGGQIHACIGYTFATQIAQSLKWPSRHHPAATTLSAS